MITLMKRLKHKLIQLSAISKEKLSMIGFIFVDDTDLTKSKLYQSTTEIDEILEEMQNTIDTQKTCLKTTGGAIYPDKSFVYAILFRFNSKGEYKYETIKEIRANLSVKDEFNE